ncbi:MAG: methylated-DNA--[protein]-cysteine S-methyltransferase [Peptococcaceae bacterium]|nr:methylated-DNA--[protein]-cysteine S-methyltransferase [Peptococcaceae bacterium]
MENLDPKTVFYWSEPVRKNDAAFELFTAVCNRGLICSGLGQRTGYRDQCLRDVEATVEKYLRGYRIVPDKGANLSVIRQIREYLEGLRQEFTINLYPLGTEFQMKVWEELRNIPYGETCSYSEIAEKIACPKGQRAVGMANNRNPLGVVVPCHRVIGKKGDLVGYAGGLGIKKMLLELEKQGKKESFYE